MISLFPTGYFPAINAVTVADAKAWLNIEHDRHNTIIAGMTDAAVKAFENLTGLDLSATSPDALQAAYIKALAGVFYENRESAAVVDIKDIPAFRAIITQYRSIAS